MGKFFDVDSPFMSGLTKMADLMILNLLTALFFAPAQIWAFIVLRDSTELGSLGALIFCFPLSILGGAALTALHYVCLKIVRNEESYIVKSFFRSFKQNFKQSTLIWIIYMVIFAIVGYDFLIIFSYPEESFPGWVVGGLTAMGILLLCLALHTFALQARFVNKIGKTIKNSALVGLATWPKTIIQLVIFAIPTALPVWLLMKAKTGDERFESLLSPLILVCLLFGFSLSAWGRAKIYNSTFKRFEPKDETEDPDAWTMSEEDSEPAEDSENASEEVTEDSVLEIETNIDGTNDDGDVVSEEQTEE